MHFVIALSCLLAVANAYPKDLTVIRPNHYLQQGTFGKEQHLLPNSFYTPGEQLADELRNLQVVPQQHGRETRALQPEQVSTQGTDASEQVAITVPSSAEQTVQDSYANIGGASGRVASALTNTNEYGEKVPEAFSNLQQDSYAYYHGHN